MMCKGDYYDVNSDTGGIVFIILAGLYIGLATYLMFRMIHVLLRSHSSRDNYFFIGFFLFMFLELLIRIIYFPGCIKPFCYSKTLYNILADYPCLAQSLSMIMLICRYLETLALIQQERKDRFGLFKLIALAFAGVYSLLYVASHTYEDLSGNIEFNYVIALIGQIVILAAFTLTSMYLMQQIGQVYSLLASAAMRYILIAFAVLLSLRIVLTILNITGTTRDLRENGNLYMLVVGFFMAFEVAPAVLLLILSFLQEKQTRAVNTKRRSVKDILKNSASSRDREIPADALVAHDESSKGNDED